MLGNGRFISKLTIRTQILTRNRIHLHSTQTLSSISHVITVHVLIVANYITDYLHLYTPSSGSLLAEVIDIDVTMPVSGATQIEHIYPSEIIQNYIIALLIANKFAIRLDTLVYS